MTVDKNSENVNGAQQAIVTLPSGQTLNVDPFRSLLVVDQEVRDLFSFEEVMTLLVQRSGLTNLSAATLYQQWWDTNNDYAHAFTSGPHCTPPPEPYNMFCPRQEGTLANMAKSPIGAGATGANGYFPLAFVNRFDLAPADGAHCGEYRILFAKNSGKTKSNDRLLIAFEGRLPNPNPSQGLAACRPVAQFWADLSNIEDVDTRAAQIRNFYVNGLPGFSPVIHPDNYGLKGGQIRTNQFMFFVSAQLWQLKEYKFVKTCTNPQANTGCKLEIWNVNAADNPDPELFSTETNNPQLAAQAQAAFLANMPSLLGGTLEDIKLNMPSQFGTYHSDAFNKVNDYTARLGNNPNFQAAIRTRLVELGSNLTWDNVTDRATFQSCSGCHLQKSGKAIGGDLIWPPSNIFTHVDEARTETIVDDLGNHIGTRPLISPALKTTWLPLRKQILERYLAATP
ncbi:MAG: hypothetical protein QM820_34670 [Minicystis sp.]